MENFNYHRPASVDDAVKAAKAKPEAKYMSGGMTLIPTMKQGLASPSDIIDLGALKNSGVSLGASLVIKAGTTHAEVAASADVKKAIPALAGLAANIGDPHVRHKGTIGGSVANNDPAACYPSAVLALGATVHTNSRTIAADDFFQGMFTTALQEGELITAISFPIPQKAAYMKFKQPASRFAMVGVFVAQFDTGVRVAVTGAANGVFRHKGLEDALNKSFTVASAAGVKIDASDLNADIHASAAYRANLISVQAQRAVAKMLG